MAIGHIKVDRALQDHWLFRRNDPVTIGEAWVLLLMWANYKDDSENINGTIVQCSRGQIIYSLDTYATRFRWDKSKVRRFFEKLQKNDMIVIEGLKNTTRLTICNYELYQGDRHSNDTLTTLSRHSRDTLATPSKEVKKEISKEVNNNNELFEEPKPTKPKKESKPKAEKKVYGSFGNVLLSDEEYKKLSDRFTEDTTKSAIEIYSTWKEQKQANRKSDYSGLLANDAWPFQRASEKNKAKISASDQALTRQQQKINNQASIEDWKVYKSL